MSSDEGTVRRPWKGLSRRFPLIWSRETADMFDFDQNCDIVTRNPDGRTGPFLLRAAVRAVVHHRPLAGDVELRLQDGQTLGEIEIEAIYIIGALPT